MIAAALGLLDERGSDAVALADVMEAAQTARTREFTAGLGEVGFAERFLASRLGSTTHVSVVDGAGRACTVTTTNGEGCGVVVPGTGLYPNNIMGEEDLNPFGFHSFPPRRRMPSMMAPTVVMGKGGVELVLGSAGSNRIRSAIVQVIAGVIDRGLDARHAVEAPRLHFEDDVVFTEPGIDIHALRAAGREVREFRPPEPLLRRRPGGRARPGNRRALGRRRPTPRRRGGGGMRRALLPAAVVLLLSGCAGGTPSADLFVVTRSGSIPGAKLTLLVSDGGFVRCNGGPEREISSEQLIDARELLRELEGEREEDGPIDADLTLAPRPGSILRYKVRAEDGAVAFADNSLRQPQVFYELAKFTRDVAKGACGLQR